MKNKITNIQIASILFLIIFSSTIGIGPFISIKLSGVDAYISVLIGSVIGIIPLFIFIYIFNYKPNYDINDKNKIIFGKTFGTIINIILIILYFIVGITIIFNISNFTVSQYLTETPIILIIIIIGITIYYIVNKGINTISKISFIYFIIIIFILIVSVSGMFPSVKMSNIKPILEFGLKKPFITSLLNSIVFLMPIYTILIIPKDNIKNKEKTTKIFIIFYIMTMLFISTLSFITSSVLGKYLLNFFQYPVYITLKRISVFGFIDRIENFLSLQWILSSFINLSMIVYYMKSLVKKNNNKLITAIIVLLLIISSYYIFKTNTLFNNYLTNIYPYILLATFLIYGIIFISIFIRKKIKK